MNVLCDCACMFLRYSRLEYINSLKMSQDRGHYYRYLQPGSRMRIPRSTRFNRSNRNGVTAPNLADNNPEPFPNENIDGDNGVMDNDINNFNAKNFGEDNDRANAENIGDENDRVIHAVVDIRVMDILLLIFVFSVRHNLDWTAMESLAKLISFILGDNLIPKSKYYFKKVFSPKQNIRFHFLCKRCKRFLGTRRQIEDFETNFHCPICQDDIDMRSKSTHLNFVSFSIETQLKEHIERYIRSGDIKFHHEYTRHDGRIADIFDGEAYRKLIAYNNGNKFLTLTVSTDGASIHKSTKKSSMWPLQYLVNEICEKKRYSIDNVLLAALSYGGTPDMSCFLRPFIEEVNAINDKGGITIAINGTTEKVKIYPLVWVLDSVAKCYVLRIIQYNGYYGCPYCHHAGTLIQRNNIRYCKIHNACERTDQNSRNAMQRAHRNNVRVKGYSGISPLCALPLLDVVWQCAIDKMHNVDLGVMKKFFCLLLDSRNKDKW